MYSVVKGETKKFFFTDSSVISYVWFAIVGFEMVVVGHRSVMSIWKLGDWEVA